MEHLLRQTQEGERIRSGALMELKLRIASVKNRLKDMEESREKGLRLSGRLRSGKIQLSGALLLFQKEQSRFESLRKIIERSDMCWAGFPQRLAQLMRALSERQTLRDDVADLWRALRDSQNLRAATWFLRQLQGIVEEECGQQVKVYATCEGRVKEEDEQTVRSVEAVRQQIDRNVEEAQRLEAGIHALQREGLDLQSQVSAFNDIAQGAWETMYGSVARSVTQTVRERVVEVEQNARAAALRRAEHQLLYRERDTTVQALKTRIASAKACYAEKCAAWRAKFDQCVQERRHLEGELSTCGTRQKEASAATYSTHRCILLLVSLCTAAASHTRQIENRRSERHQRRGDFEARRTDMRHQHEAVVARRFREAWERSCAEQRAALEAEECLTRRPFELDVQQSLTALLAMESAERERIASHRPRATTPVPQGTPMKQSVRLPRAPHSGRRVTASGAGTHRRRRRHPSSASRSVSSSFSPALHTTRTEVAAPHSSEPLAILSPKTLRATYPYAAPKPRPRDVCGGVPMRRRTVHVPAATSDVSPASLKKKGRIAKQSDKDDDLDMLAILSTPPTPHTTRIPSSFSTTTDPKKQRSSNTNTKQRPSGGRKAPPPARPTTHLLSGRHSAARRSGSTCVHRSLSPPPRQPAGGRRSGGVPGFNALTSALEMKGLGEVAAGDGEGRRSSLIGGGFRPSGHTTHTNKKGTLHHSSKMFPFDSLMQGDDLFMNGC